MGLADSPAGLAASPAGLAASPAGLAASPAGLAAWIVAELRAWSDDAQVTRERRSRAFSRPYRRAGG